MNTSATPRTGSGDQSWDSHDVWAIELTLAPADLPLLLRHPMLRHAGGRKSTARGSKVGIIWHDTPGALLAADGLSLAQRSDQQGTSWIKERLIPDAIEITPPGAPPALIDRTPSPPELHAPLLPIAGFDGTIRDLSPAEAKIRVSLLQGDLRAVTATRQICRLSISCADAETQADLRSLALELALALPVGVAPHTLAAEAAILANRTPPSRPLGAPALRAGQTAGEGFAHIVAHLAGVIIHHAANVSDNAGPEPVHQMRVALRRLRSAILLFRRAVSCPALADVNERLKQLGAILGPPRDWDVFTLGTGRDIAKAFPDDASVAALLAAAERQRLSGYAALRLYLDSPAWRQLGVALAHLATTRPWRHFTPEDPEQAHRHAELQQTDIRDFAARTLGKRLETMVAPGPDISGLDTEALHEIRLHGKRLRYAAEFFAQLFPGGATRRFLRRMTALQERLGVLNDGAVAANLMLELPGRGAGHHYATGVVKGFVAAKAAGGKRKIIRTWQRFLKQDRFW
jgi:triphosphatase